MTVRKLVYRFFKAMLLLIAELFGCLADIVRKEARKNRDFETAKECLAIKAFLRELGWTE